MTKGDQSVDSSPSATQRRISLRGRIARLLPFLHPATRPGWFSNLLHRWFPNAVALTPRVYHEDEFISLARLATIEFLREWAGKVEGRVLDVGCGKWRLPRELFSDHAEYISCDSFEHPNIDVVCSILDLDGAFEESSFDAVICSSVVEHVTDPRQAVRQMHRVLKPGGVLLLTVPFRYPLHGTEVYKDYWRFTEEGLELLLEDFAEVQIAPVGPRRSPLIYCVVARR